MSLENQSSMQLQTHDARATSFDIKQTKKQQRTLLIPTGTRGSSRVFAILLNALT